MENITSNVRETVLDLVVHENHKRLANMIMDGYTLEQTQVAGFDELQFNEFKGLIESVLDGRTPLKAETPVEVAETTQPEDVQTPAIEDNSTEVNNEVPVEADVVDTEPATTEPATEIGATDEPIDPTPAQLPSEEAVKGEMPA